MPTEVTIEKLIYGGDGLARLPADERGRGKALFVPFVLEGERVAAEMVEEKPGFARGRLARVLTPSPARAEPLCPYFQRCGGCHYQHTGYAEQLRIKTEILRETLRRTAKLEWAGDIVAHPSPPWEYRNRTRMRVRIEPEFQLGYNYFGSNELLPVERCPISSPLIHRAIAAVWELGRAGAVPSGVTEIEFFTDHEDSRMLLELYVRDLSATDGEAFYQRLRKAMPELAGAAMFPTGRPEPEPLAAFGEPHLDYVADGNRYRASAGSFFQTNRHMTAKLVELVTANESGVGALDLYAGVGLFSVPLARVQESAGSGGGALVVPRLASEPAAQREGGTDDDAGVSGAAAGAASGAGGRRSAARRPGRRGDARARRTGGAAAHLRFLRSIHTGA